MTLFFRLLRVYRIFNKMSPIGSAWSDKFLILYITAMILVSILVHVVWVASDEFGISEIVFFNPYSAIPYFLVFQFCVSNHYNIFFSVTFCYSAIFIIFVMILAVLTRKVSIDTFKDTKLVNCFVFCSIGSLVLLTTLSFIFYFNADEVSRILGFFLYIASLLVVTLFCVFLLFIPKIHKAQFPKDIVRSKSLGTRTSLTFLQEC